MRTNELSRDARPSIARPSTLRASSQEKVYNIEKIDDNDDCVVISVRRDFITLMANALSSVAPEIPRARAAWALSQNLRTAANVFFKKVQMDSLIDLRIADSFIYEDGKRVDLLEDDDSDNSANTEFVDEVIDPTMENTSTSAPSRTRAMQKS